MKRFALILLCLAVVSGSPLLAQAQKGSISATVVGDDGQPLPGVTMDVSATDTLTRRSVVTNAQGFAEAPALDPSSAYTVMFSIEGMATVQQDAVRVRAGQTTALSVTMTMSSVSETIQVTGEAPVVDVTNAITGQDITLELTESLPTGRSYQSYLQLVPGVLPDSTEFGGNPASRSGVNYSDIFGQTGVSTDNFYYIEGINVTDNTSGTFGANLNTEIIQEQSVLTGGIPAEYAGASGLISNVITKSGGNNFSGSVNYYFQNDSLVSDNENRPDQTFDAYDAAVTFGGPIVKDKAWFFLSYRKVERDEDVIGPDGEFLRTVNIDNDQSFAKASWSITPSTLISATFLDDPQDRSGTTDETQSNARDFARSQGGERYTGRLTQVWSNFLFEASYSEHEGDLDNLSKGPAPRNDITFLAPYEPTQFEEQLGDYGLNTLRTRGNDSWNVSGEASFDSSWGSHTLKAGYESLNFDDYRNTTYVDNSLFVSLSNIYLGQGTTLLDILNAGTIVNFDPENESDVGGLNEFGCARNPAQCAPFDTNHDGTLDFAEASAIPVQTTTGNPNGMINYNRDFLAQVGPQAVASEGTTYYIQDTWQYNRFSVNAGVRFEKWDHFATTGEKIYSFDEEVAPRVSLAYDLKGDGRQRLSAYYGRYYDPIRNNMTQFAGTLSGNIIEEQIWVGNDWATFRVRGGPQVADALFAPTTQTPYTDEWMVGYKADLGNNMSIEANYIQRETRDILEDYDMGLYAVDSAGEVHYPGPIDDPNSLYLGLGYFGYPGSAPPPSNFVIATLAGGERNWEGIELIFRKRYSNNWQMMASASISDAEGNSNSDSNADFQGDVIWLDPQSPNQYGTQPGLIENLFKVGGSYGWDNGLELGGGYRYASGIKTSKTWFIFSRNLPCRVALASCGTSAIPAFQFAGMTQRWIEPGVVGGLDNPSYGVLDARLSYEHTLGEWGNLDLFLDVFNVLDDQETTREQDIFAGNGGVQFGEGLEFVEPRRYYLGARIRF